MRNGVARSLCHVSCSSDVRFQIGDNSSKGRDAYCCNIKILAANVWSEKKGRNYLQSLNLISFTFPSTL